MTEGSALTKKVRIVDEVRQRQTERRLVELGSERSITTGTLETVRVKLFSIQCHILSGEIPLTHLTHFISMSLTVGLPLSLDKALS